MELEEFNTPKRSRYTEFNTLAVDMKKDERRLRRQMAHDLQFNRDVQKRMPTVAKTFKSDYSDLKKVMPNSKAMEIALRNASKAVQLAKAS